MYPMDVLGEQREPFTVTSSTLFPTGGDGEGTYTVKLPVSAFELSPEASVTKIWKEEAPGAVVAYCAVPLMVPAVLPATFCTATVCVDSC